MRCARTLAALATLGVLGGAATALNGDGVEITSAVLRSRLVSVAYFDGTGPPRIPLVDVRIRGLLPEGFDLDPSEAPIPVEVILNGTMVLAGESRPVSVAPSGRGSTWSLFEPGYEEGVVMARWMRVRPDPWRGSFRFRTRYEVDHAVMEGDPAAVPYLVRIGDREFSGTLEFKGDSPCLWQWSRWEPRRIPPDNRR